MNDGFVTAGFMKDGYAAAFLYALDGGPRYEAPICARVQRLSG